MVGGHDCRDQDGSVHSAHERLLTRIAEFGGTVRVMGLFLIL